MNFNIKPNLNETINDYWGRVSVRGQSPYHSLIHAMSSNQYTYVFTTKPVVNDIEDWDWLNQNVFFKHYVFIGIMNGGYNWLFNDPKEASQFHNIYK
jgi:hypothetical protein